MNVVLKYGASRNTILDIRHAGMNCGGSATQAPAGRRARQLLGRWESRLGRLDYTRRELHMFGHRGRIQLGLAATASIAIVLAAGLASSMTAPGGRDLAVG